MINPMAPCNNLSTQILVQKGQYQCLSSFILEKLIIFFQHNYQKKKIHLRISTLRPINSISIKCTEQKAISIIKSMYTCNQATSLSLPWHIYIDDIWHH